MRALRELLKPLQHTPFHPQWLALGHRRDQAAWIMRNVHGTLIDVGCGDANLRAVLGSSVQYVGIDYPATMALGYSGSPSIFADATHLPIASNSVDAVLLLDVLEHVTDPAGTIAEAARILRPGGLCLIHVPFLYPLHDEPYDYHRWTEYGLTGLMTAHGFNVPEIQSTTSPIETAAALTSIALAMSAIDSIRKPSLSILATPLLVLMIPIVNILGWALGKLMPFSNFMPFSYRLLARR